MQFNDDFHPYKNQIQSTVATGTQVSIRSEIHNIRRPLSLLFKHWKKINMNRLINTGINTGNSVAEVGGGRWRSMCELVVV